MSMSILDSRPVQMNVRMDRQLKEFVPRLGRGCVSFEFLRTVLDSEAELR